MSTQDTINDTNNGRIIAPLREEGHFLSVPEHAGLIICCDGVQFL